MVAARRRVWPFVLALALCVISLAAGAAFAQDPSKEEIELRSDLWSIRTFRNGLSTDYDAMHKRARELLDKYADDPAAQGRICVEVVLDHALSGLGRPQEAIEFAKMAEQLPLSPCDKAQLYLSWGNAVEFTTPGAKGERMRQTRKAAAEVYLKSMKVALENTHSLVTPPEPIAPEGINVMEHVLIEIPDGLSPEAKEAALRHLAQIEERKRQKREYWEKKAEWQRQADIIARSVYSRDLIIQLYALFPYDTAEIEGLAREILGDDEWVNDLVGRVEARIKERLEKAGLAMSGEVADELMDNLNLIPSDEEAATVEAEVVEPEAAPAAAAEPAPTVRSRRRWAVAAAAVVAVWVAVWGFSRKRRTSPAP